MSWRVKRGGTYIWHDLIMSDRDCCWNDSVWLFSEWTLVRWIFFQLFCSVSQPVCMGLFIFLVIRVFIKNKIKKHYKFTNVPLLFQLLSLGMSLNQTKQMFLLRKVQVLHCLVIILHLEVMIISTGTVSMEDQNLNF